MGLQDRDYYKDDATSGYVTSVTVKLIIVNCAIFLANVLFGGVNNLLALHDGSLVRPWNWYEFLTYGFVHGSIGAPQKEDLWHIVGNMIGLYFFGRAIEDRYGWKEFLRYYLIAIVLGGIVWAIRTHYATGAMVGQFGNLPIPDFRLLGASGGVTAVVILFCLLYPRATLLLFFAIPTPAWVAGLFIVASDMFLVKRDNVAHDVHLAGAAFALAYWYFGWNFGRLPGMSGLSKAAKSLGKSLKPKPDLRVHDPEAHYEDLDAEADRLLVKWRNEGESSLTPRERRILEDYSRRMRQKHR